MINVYQLQIFLTVVERGSFSSAAFELNMSQPAVSQQVRALEEYYKVKLFVRAGQRIELTEAGFALVIPARHLIAEALKLEEQFNAGSGEFQGRINLVYSQNLISGLYMLPSILCKFHKIHPAVQFFVEGASEQDAIDRVLERQASFALLSNLPRQKLLDSFLLYSDSIVVVLPPGHPLNGEICTLQQLKGQSLILSRTGSETRRVFELALRMYNLNLNDFRSVAEFDRLEGVILSIRAGMGIGLLSKVIAQNFPDLGTAFITTDGHVTKRENELTNEVYIIRLQPTPDRLPSPSQQRFWEDLLYS